MLLLPLLASAALTLAPVQSLHAWDERRSDAWAAGDVAGLRALYTPGSAAGRADVAMLHAWQDRGLRVTGLRMQLFAVDVRRRTTTRLVLDVTDRLVGGVVVPGRVALPQDRPTRHLVVLRRVAGQWRVASVGPSSPVS